jgi:hypothetical protein
LVAVILMTAGCQTRNQKLAWGIGGLAAGAVTIGAGASMDAPEPTSCGPNCTIHWENPGGRFIALGIIWATIGAISLFTVQAEPKDSTHVGQGTVFDPSRLSPLERLAYEARVAAATGDCAAVARLAGKVNAMDPAYFKRSFASDLAIAACLAR